MSAIMDVVCEHCGRAQSKYAISKHRKNCPEKPENREKALQCLKDPLNPGYALSERRYEAGKNSPCSNTLRAHYGKWSEVAAAFGLELMHSNDLRLADKLEATGNVLRRLSQVLHSGKFGPSLREYEQEVCGNRHGAMEKTGLYRRFGDWAGVLRHFGLPPSNGNGNGNGGVKQSDGGDETTPHYRAPYWQSVELPAWSLKYGFQRGE